MKHKKITLLQKNCDKERLEDYSTSDSNRCRVVFQSFFTTIFLQKDSLLVFHPCLVSALYTGPSLTVVNFDRKFFTPINLCEGQDEHSYKLMSSRPTCTCIWNNNRANIWKMVVLSISCTSILEKGSSLSACSLRYHTGKFLIHWHVSLKTVTHTCHFKRSSFFWHSSTFQNDESSYPPSL